MNRTTFLASVGMALSCFALTLSSGTSTGVTNHLVDKRVR